MVLKHCVKMMIPTYLTGCLLVMITFCLVLPSMEQFIKSPTDQFVIQVAEGKINGIIDELASLKVNFLRKINISSGYYLFEYTKHDEDRERIFEYLENKHNRNKITRFERVREYGVDLELEPISAAAVSSDDYTTFQYFRRCPTFSNMGVEEVWTMGYTGKNIVIAVLDVGMNTSIPDIKHRIRKDLSFNIVDNNTDVSPEICTYNKKSDHGNRCSGIIGAEKNTICGDGIDYDGSIVAIKIFKIRENVSLGLCSIEYKTTWIAEGLVHAIGHVDIYSSSWGSNEAFHDRSFLIADALRNGAKKGRGGKGAVYVFPSDDLADPFTNDIHTIAVSGVGGLGQIPPFASVCACTLTSAYAERSETENIALYTTTNYQKHCTLEFKGTSAATAIVSGIIGLALQANPALSYRDVQDSIVQASDVSDLRDKQRFVKNGVGKMYHPVLGFGLLNATRLVHIAKNKAPLPAQMKITSRCTRARRKWEYHLFDSAEIKIKCKKNCINRTENVIMELSYETPNEHDCELLLTSPMGTTSLLMDRKQSSVKRRVDRQNIMFKSVNFWGENAEGVWTLQMKQHGYNSDFKLLSCKLDVYGTGYLMPTRKHIGEKETVSKVQGTTYGSTQSVQGEKLDVYGTGYLMPTRKHTAEKETVSKVQGTTYGSTQSVQGEDSVQTSDHSHLTLLWVSLISTGIIAIFCQVAYVRLRILTQIRERLRTVSPS